ncbi:MAG TPA: tRNA isopentenyl-2-thiomethyl-A-37 hydroxylase MiaE [Terriglobia bacterium]|nr:tRNA isopentenyl-2-thiomethyl-A-37 hydroxylase MiaE [Terriglobia bacterium]
MTEFAFLSETPTEWAQSVLEQPLALLVDHAYLERKAASNALELMNRWPGNWTPGWVETMTSIARDETAHLARVTRLLIRRGGKLERLHRNPYANALRQLVRKGGSGELLDRLLISAMIEARSCERFGALAAAARDADFAKLFASLYASELGHYKVFLKLAARIAGRTETDARWKEIVKAEAAILALQAPGPQIHSGYVSNATFLPATASLQRR